MSTEKRLSRLGLSELADKPEELEKALKAKQKELEKKKEKKELNEEDTDKNNP